MGGHLSKPKFVTVLAEQNVQTGDKISLCCKVNKKNVKVTWEKDGERLVPVEGKHALSTANNYCILEIKNAQPSDNGMYTLKINGSDSETCSAFVRVEIPKWRHVNWDQIEMFVKLKEFKICETVPELHFLTVGPVGAGKSSSINTIKSVFEQCQFIHCLGAASSETSKTRYFKKVGVSNRDGCFPFAFYDIMGFEHEGGVLTDDIIEAIKGHMKEGYMFNATFPLSENNKYYNKTPSMSDRIHCLIYILSATEIMTMSIELLTKIKTVREKASNMELPQVVFLTRIDCICPLTKDDLQKVYSSKKIHEKIEECSNLIGVPANCIFPVKNYSEETHMNDNINCLIMDALIQMINYANDYVKNKKCE